jgi:hypothetical protein
MSRATNSIDLKSVLTHSNNAMLLNPAADLFVPRTAPTRSTGFGGTSQLPGCPIRAIENIFRANGIKRLKYGPFERYANSIGEANVQMAYEKYLYEYQQYLVLTIAEALGTWEAEHVWSCHDTLMQRGSLTVLGIGQKDQKKGAPGNRTIENRKIENLGPAYLAYLKTRLSQVYAVAITKPVRVTSQAPTPPTNPRQQHTPIPGHDSGYGSQERTSRPILPRLQIPNPLPIPNHSPVPNPSPIPSIHQLFPVRSAPQQEPELPLTPVPYINRYNIEKWLNQIEEFDLDKWRRDSPWNKGPALPVRRRGVTPVSPEKRAELDEMFGLMVGGW